MTISNESMEVAIRAIVASLPNSADLETHRPWATIYARAALEAAAPMIRAEALEEAAARGDAEMDHYYWGYEGVSDTLREWAAVERGRQ